MKRKVGPSQAKPPKKKPKLTRQPTLAFQKNTVKRGPEVKNLDVDDTATTGTQINMGASVSTWIIGATQLLNGMAQGTSGITRLGRKTQGIKLNINMTAQLQATSTNGGVVRVRVVYDKQPNKAIFAITDYLAIDAFDSALNLDQADRFITLGVADFEVSTQNKYADSKKLNIKMSLESMYTGAGATIANITTGSIYFICAQDGSIATTGPSLSVYSRYRFKDN